MKLSKPDHRKLLVERFSKDDEPLKYTHDKLNELTLVEHLVDFTARFPAFSKALFNLRGEVEHIGHGIGRGEMLIYFLYDDVALGGSATSTDIIINKQPLIEVKTATRRGDVWVDFRLGTDEWVASHHLMGDVVRQLIRLDGKGKLTAPEHLGNIPKSLLTQVKALAPKSYATAEEEYFKRLFSSRLGEKKFIFFDSSTRLPIYFGKLEKSQLTIDRFSAGQAKLTFDPTACLIS